MSLNKNKVKWIRWMQGKFQKKMTRVLEFWTLRESNQSQEHSKLSTASTVSLSGKD